MRYIGSKRRIAKHILPILLKEANESGISTWVEPFVGGANLIDKVPNTFRRIGVDSNEYLIEMWKHLLSGWIPPDFVSEDEWRDVRDKMDGAYPKHYIAFVRFCCSFGSDWFGGYARTVKKDAPNAEELNRTTKSFCLESKRGLMRQLSKLTGVEFVHGDYTCVSTYEDCLIYCDPPYKNTTSYNGAVFDYDKFWNWCRKMSEKNAVFISEYNAPNDFVCVWEGDMKNTLAGGRLSGVNTTEKLFKLG